MREANFSEVMMDARRCASVNSGCISPHSWPSSTISVVYLALPAIGKSLGAGIADQQWIVNIYALMEGGVPLASGTLGDLFGRKRVFVSGVGLFVPGALGSALAMTPTALIVARLIQGIGGRRRP